MQMLPCAIVYSPGATFKAAASSGTGTQRPRLSVRPCTKSSTEVSLGRESHPRSELKQQLSGAPCPGRSRCQSVLEVRVEESQDDDASIRFSFSSNRTFRNPSQPQDALLVELIERSQRLGHIVDDVVDLFFLLCSIESSPSLQVHLLVEHIFSTLSCCTSDEGTYVPARSLEGLFLVSRSN